eukprot:1746109-Lingulodinium_polyedra.AAC.1
MITARSRGSSQGGPSWTSAPRRGRLPNRWPGRWPVWSPGRRRAFPPRKKMRAVWEPPWQRQWPRRRPPRQQRRLPAQCRLWQVRPVLQRRGQGLCSRWRRSVPVP